MCTTARRLYFLFQCSIRFFAMVRGWLSSCFFVLSSRVQRFTPFLLFRGHPRLPLLARFKPSSALLYFLFRCILRCDCLSRVIPASSFCFKAWQLHVFRAFLISLELSWFRRTILSPRLARDLPSLFRRKDDCASLLCFMAALFPFLLRQIR